MMKVSVVTPSFNQARFIERTLDSVRHQVGAEVEHLVFDGGSGDGTVDILGRCGPGVAWTSARDDGQADAVNQGFRAATGDVIGWLNSDDVYRPGAIARVVEYFAGHPDVDVVYGKADLIDADDHALGSYPTEPWNLERLKDVCYICQPALFMRREVVRRHGALDGRLHYCMDYEYWLRLGRAGVRFAYLPETLAASRMYETNKTLGSRVAVHREINDMMKGLFGSVPDSWLINYAHAVVETRMQRARNPKLFAVRVGLGAVSASLRWNHGMSRTMMKRLSERLGGLSTVRPARGGS